MLEQGECRIGHRDLLALPPGVVAGVKEAEDADG
jgi:hypothetical protein